MSNDGARVYSVCKDSTVYVYSTNHVALGQNRDSSQRWIRTAQDQEKGGLGPLYGLRHDCLDVKSFYIRASVRKTVDDHGELLAVGSSSKNPCVFPTDERQIRLAGGESGVPLQSLATRVHDQRQIFRCGTSLRNGHDAEVTSLAWSFGGGLVSLADDLKARLWRDGSAEDGMASRLRRDKGMETMVDHLQYGFASGVTSEWDDEDG